MRRLRILALDPSLRRSAGQMATIEVPWEPLGPEFAGTRLKIVTHGQPFEHGGTTLNLDDPALAGQDGVPPVASDPRFLQQMVYGVAHWTLRRFAAALGREPQFAFPGCLALHPYAMREPNAYYSRAEQALKFGWFPTARPHGLGPAVAPVVFTAAAHDIVIHEMTHALLDGQRPALLLPTNVDVLAFHEGFADLIALFARFTHVEVVTRAMERSEGRLDDETLISIGRQFGRGQQGGRGPLRTAILDPADYESERPAQTHYDNTWLPHARGSLLVSAVFEAFRTVYERKTRRWRELTAGSPLLSRHPVLLAACTRTATQLAAQFLNILIRALDYLPPVDVDFSDFLRAMITADADLVPTDEWNYREALIYAFLRYGIRLDCRFDVNEEALRWQGPERDWTLDTQPLAKLAHLPVGSLGRAAHRLAVRKFRFHILRQFLQSNAAQFRQRELFQQGAAGSVEVTVNSLRAVQRIGPDGRLMTQYVAEVLSWQRLPDFGWYPGGATLVISEEGRLRYLIHKRLGNSERQQRALHYRLGAGLRYGAVFDAQHPEHVMDAAAQLLSGLHTRCCESV